MTRIMDLSVSIDSYTAFIVFFLFGVLKTYCAFWGSRSSVTFSLEGRKEVRLVASSEPVEFFRLLPYHGYGIKWLADSGARIGAHGSKSYDKDCLKKSRFEYYGVGVISDKGWAESASRLGVRIP